MVRKIIITLLPIIVIGCFGDKKEAEIVKVNVLDCSKNYAFKKEDTINNIAKRCHIPIKKLAEMNNLSYPYKVAEGSIIILKEENLIIGNKNWQMPIAAKITKKFSPKNQHTGISFASKEDQYIYSIADGVVIHTSNQFLGHKKIIIIKHNNDIYSAYTQNKKVFVSENDVVKKGQKVGLAGNNDFYFEMRIGSTSVNPLKFIKK